MPRLLLMGTAVTRCQQRANMEGDDSIAPAEWKSLISEVYGELYEEVADSGARYFETESTDTTTGAAYIDEPADQLSLVDNLEVLIDSAGRLRRLKPLAAQERALYAGRSGEARRYAMIDDRIYLYPTPATGTQITLRYIPQSPDLSGYADGEAMDVVTAAGEAFLIWGVCLIGKSKDERFVDLASDQKEKARVRLQQWARNRAFHESPRRFVDDDDIADGDWLDGYLT